MKSKINFIDFDISLQDNGDIVLGEGLTLNQLDLREGQVLKVKLVEGRVAFRKIDWAELTLKENGY